MYKLHLLQLQTGIVPVLVTATVISLKFFIIKVLLLKSTRPSLPLKKAPPLISVFSPQGRRGKPPSGAQNRYAIRLSDHQRSSPYYAGWDRLNHYLSYHPIVLMKDTPF